MAVPIEELLKDCPTCGHPSYVECPKEGKIISCGSCYDCKYYEDLDSYERCYDDEMGYCLYNEFVCSKCNRLFDPKDPLRPKGEHEGRWLPPIQDRKIEDKMCAECIVKEKLSSTTTLHSWLKHELYKL